MRRLCLAACAATICGGVPAAHAQSLGAVLTANVSQLFEYETNPFLFDDDDPRGGDLAASVTNFGLGLLSETTTQQFGLAADFALRLQDGEAVDNRNLDNFLVDPFGVRATYGQQWADGEVTGGLRFRQREIEFDRRLSDILGDDDGSTPGDGDDAVDDLRVVTETGSRRDYGANLGLALATDAPSSYELNLGAARTDFSDDLAGVDRSVFDGSATWNLRVTETLRTGLTAFYSDSRPDEDTEIAVRRIGLTGNLFYQINPNFGFGGRLGYSERREERTDAVTGETVTTDDSGPVAAVSFDYETQLLRLAGDLGVNATGETLQPVGNVALSYLLPRAEITGALNQRFTFDEDGEEISRTTARLGVTRPLDSRSSADFGLSFDRQSEATDRNQDVVYRYGISGGYTRELTPLSSARFGVGLAHQDETDDNINRVNLSAVYSRTLTQDVQANLGYQYRYRDDDDGSLDSQRVFFSIGRSFGGTP